MATQQENPSALTKISRSTYLIISISVLTHALSLIYSLLTTQQLTRAYISIIVSSLGTFYVSKSHLTLYGVSVLGTLYLNMIQSYYQPHQVVYITAMSGILLFVFWKPIHSWGTIFHCLPGRIHASLVFGIVLLVLTRFFPLAIENIDAFFQLATNQAFQNPFSTLASLFSKFNFLTLVLTIEAITMMFLMKSKLEKIPLIGIVVILGLLINTGHKFKSYEDVCQQKQIHCEFQIIHKNVLQIPTVEDVITVIPSAVILSIAILFEQFLFIEQFARRGRMYAGQGTLGQVSNQTKVLAIANLISGCLGGLPVCVNILATYENFAYNKKYGFSGTKWVSIFQIILGFIFYTVLNKFFLTIPLFVFFIIAATPAIYFLQNAVALRWQNLPTIVIIASISTFTHPIIALVYACLVTIYDVAALIKPALAQMWKETRQTRKSQSVREMSVIGMMQKQKEKQGENKGQLENNIKKIDGDVPVEYEENDLIIYRFIGSLNFLNFYNHIKSINKMIESYKPQQTLILSFRYAQIIDSESVYDFSMYVQNLREAGVSLVMSGLHHRVISQMQENKYFAVMMQEEHCMYSLIGPK